MNAFDYFNVGEVDPSFKTLPSDIYKLRISKMEPSVVEPKKGKNAGKQVPLVKATLTVVDHEKYSGRRLWPTFWIDTPFDQRALRKIADVTGIQQEPGPGTFEAWLEALNIEQPTFMVPVTETLEVDRSTGLPILDDKGEPTKKNVISFKDATPA